MSPPRRLHPSPAAPLERYVSCQPAPAFHGRVPDWVAELRKGREQGETAVLVAETTGRAERVIEILRDYGVVAVDISRGGGLGQRAARHDRRS